MSESTGGDGMQRSGDRGDGWRWGWIIALILLIGAVTWAVALRQNDKAPQTSGNMPIEPERSTGISPPAGTPTPEADTQEAEEMESFKPAPTSTPSPGDDRQGIEPGGADESDPNSDMAH